MPDRQHRNPNAAAPGARRRKGVGRRPDWVDGTLVELDAPGQRLVIRVDGARQASVRAGTELTVGVADATLKATDADGNGRPSITDLFPGDALHVTLGPVSDDGLPRAVRVEQRSPGGPVGGLRRLGGGWRGGGA